MRFFGFIKMFHMQIEFLTRILNDDTTDAWIVGEFTYLVYVPRFKEYQFTGPPGTGKFTMYYTNILLPYRVYSEFCCDMGFMWVVHNLHAWLF